MDDSRKSVTAGACGELALTGAQRPAPHPTRLPRNESSPAPRRHRRVARVRAALGLLVLLAHPSPASAQDTTPPTLEAASVANQHPLRIVLKFSEDLQLSNLAPASAFTVTADGNAVTISRFITVPSIPTALQILVSPAIRQGQTIVVTYTDPTSGDDAHAIQDTAGNDAASFTTGSGGVPAVTNASTVGSPTTPVQDTTPPTLGQARVLSTGLSIIFRFSEDLQEANLPPASAFTVTADGVPLTVSSFIRIQGVFTHLSMRVAPGVRQGQAVVVSYTDPTSGDDANAIQDTAGNDVASFTTGSGGVPAVINESRLSPTVPGAPAALGASAYGTTAIDLSWSAPADNGGSAITGYKIEVSSDGGSNWTTRVADTDRTRTIYRHTGVPKGTTRHYRVSAINAVGTGLPSNVANASTGRPGGTEPEPEPEPEPEAEPPPPTYYFPHLAVGEGWQTTMTYINYSSQEVSCQTEFLSDDGTPLLVSFAGRGTAAGRTDVLPPGGSVHQETNVELNGPLARGWARATCSGPVKASLLYRRFEGGVPTGEAAVNATRVPATRFVTFAEQGEGRFGTGVAYANPSATAALVTFTAKDADGETLASIDETLLSNGHDAQNMVDLFGLTSFTGSLEVTSTVPIVSLSLNNEADPVFSSLPPGELDAAAQGLQQMTTYYFPHLAVGEGWQTTITYINYSPQEVGCETEFLSDHGSPLLVSFAELVTVVSRNDVLPPGGSVHEETNVELSTPLARGWARATCSGPVKASLLYRRFERGVPTGEAGVNAVTVPATRFITFAEQGEGKHGTGVAYTNPSDTTTAFLTFTVRDADGRMLANIDRTLLPRGHDAKNMVDLFDLSSFTGSLEVTSTEPIVSLSLNFEADPVFSSLPPGELDAAAQ